MLDRKAIGEAIRVLGPSPMEEVDTPSEGAVKMKAERSSVDRDRRCVSSANARADFFLPLPLMVVVVVGGGGSCAMSL
jgi:hypothetical protein